MINPLPEYFEDENIVLYDVDISDEAIKEESVFYRKLRYRIGEVVILVNALERVVEDCLLEIMNERAEDSRIWILIQDFTLGKKIARLKLIYIETIRMLKGQDSPLIANVERLFSDLEKIKQERNTFIHSNWLNNINLKYFETKVKEIKSQKGYFRVNKKIELVDLESFITKVELATNNLEELHENIQQTVWN